MRKTSGGFAPSPPPKKNLFDPTPLLDKANKKERLKSSLNYEVKGRQGMGEKKLKKEGPSLLS